MTSRLTILFALVFLAVPMTLLSTGGAESGGAPMPETDTIQLRTAQGERRLVVPLADNAGTEPDGCGTAQLKRGQPRFAAVPQFHLPPLARGHG